MTIDKGLPMPPMRRARPLKYPWPELEVGDSFLMADAKPDSAYVQANHATRRYGKTFKARKTREGMRIWRTA